MNKLIGATLVVMGLGLGMAASAGSAMAADADAGAKVFKKCAICHSLEAGKKKVGPSLAGIFGRTAGTMEGFRYSASMKDSGIVWNEDTIAAYLKDPRGYIPKNKMAFAGLKKDKDVENIIAYLKSATQ